jgi:hypothetical protein
MIIEFKNYGGHIVLDDDTGKILSVICIGEGKSDARTFYSYSRKGDKHYKLDINKL